MGVLVGKKAPEFKTDAVINGNQIVENFSLSQYLGKKYVLFFFYPADFTFVCPTEILAFQITPVAVPVDLNRNRVAAPLQQRGDVKLRGCLAVLTVPGILPVNPHMKGRADAVEGQEDLLMLPFRRDGE